MQTLVRSLVAVGALAACAFAGQALARTGTGDPAEVFRERPVNPTLPIDVVLHGQLRLRSQLGVGLDLGRGPSPTNGEPLFDDGAQLGHDARLRLAPSLFLGDDLRVFADVDVMGASL